MRRNPKQLFFYVQTRPGSFSITQDTSRGSQLEWNIFFMVFGFNRKAIWVHILKVIVRIRISTELNFDIKKKLYNFLPAWWR